MAYVGILLAVFADAMLGVVAPDRFGLQFAPPSIPLITAMYIGFRARNTGELGLAILLGLCIDCFSARPIGHFAFLYGTAAYLALRTRRYVPSDAFISHIAACLFCGAATAFLGLVIAVITVRSYVGAGLVRGLVQACTSAALAPFVFGMWDRSRLFRRSLGGPQYEFAR